MKYCPCKRCDFDGRWWDDKHSVTRPKFCPKCGVKLLPNGETQEMVAKSVALEALAETVVPILSISGGAGVRMGRNAAERILAEAERRAAEGGGSDAV